ncbi:pectin lyase F-1-like protein 3 [Colletotrichum truncatum]|uniref:Pectin lyase F-1-like protein 3 n=1 Tax=Colletotrichum truncatum TaxID=5467 RepID=A0ACC3Z289_COLTU|nr:pectin lyase F-1-like protein 3 [Colletotrichum truncatum]KAF6786529.1 pectin lyase F-1-like protein 3 [Colletotrichum truncatum]
MHFQTVPLLLSAIAAATTVSAQSVVGKAYGFATGVTGGGSAAAVTPSSAAELAKLLSDDTPRTIVIDKTWDFTGTKATGAGCDRKTCSSKNGGQLYLGTLSCGGSDNVAVSSISYDKAGTEPLIVGSNKSIIGKNGKGVLKGKGLRIKKGAKNVIIQGFEVTNLNPGIVWGGDAIDLQGGNDGVWIDHMKISLVGRMFIVTHYDGSRVTVSNNEFDGQTTTSASCNGDHYWTMMFYGKGDQVTLDKNYFHDVSGRAPKLGEPGVTGTFQASNNYFKNMKGHAFDIYSGASALLEGNVFDSVSTPITKQGASVSTVFNVKDSAAASKCSSTIGRACQVNSLASSGDWPSLAGTGALSALAKAKNYLVTPVAASKVASLVSGSAGPANVGSASSASNATPVTSTPAKESTSVKEEAAAPVASTPANTGASPAPATGAEAKAWAQCGGQGWTGATNCASGTTCVKQNEWYSQCLSSRKARSILRRRQIQA